MMEKRVPSKFKPLYTHLNNNKLFYAFHGGRGGGKSWEIADFLLITGANAKHRILCCREIQKSIKQSVHKLLSDRIVTLKLESFYQILDTEIRGLNGTEFSFSGLQNHTVDSVKSFEGATITWIEEAQTVSAYSLKILIPTVVRTPNCMIIMSMNPKLPSDAVYADYVVPDRDDTIAIQINYDENKHCPPDLIKLAEQMRDSDYDEYEHIYLGKPKEIADGAIYKSEFEQIKRENRICRVPHDSNLSVFTSWDLGILDPTAIWFFQIYGKEIRVIDYYEANNEPLAHYARIEQFDAVSEDLVEKELQLSVAQNERDQFKAENDDLKAQIEQLNQVIDSFQPAVHVVVATDYNALTADQLRSLLDEKGIKYLARDDKPTLIGLLSESNL